MFTQGKDDTTVVHSKTVSPHHVLFCFAYLGLRFCSSSPSPTFIFCAGGKVETFPVLKLDPKDIVDTNGAGDAFVGGEHFTHFHFSILKPRVSKCVLWILMCGPVVQVSCLSWSRRNHWIIV